MDDILDVFGFVAILLWIAVIIMLVLAGSLSGDYQIEVEYKYANGDSAYIIYRDIETNDVSRGQIEVEHYLCIETGDIVDATIDGLNNVELLECPER